MLRERIPMLSAMTLDQLGARMKCDRCGKRPARCKPERHARVCSKDLDGGRMMDNAIEAIRKEIVALTAENLAMQFILTSLLQRISEGNPSMRRLILQALDEAANHAENFSIVRGAKAGHLPETLRIIEQMRLMLVGKGKLKRDQ